MDEQTTPQRDKAAQFLEYMCAEGCPFSDVEKKLGKFVAVLFYLRNFEAWLRKREPQAPTQPEVTKTPRCMAHDAEQLFCTRPLGHEGPHVATGMDFVTGNTPVLNAWVEPQAPTQGAPEPDYWVLQYSDPPDMRVTINKDTAEIYDERGVCEVIPVYRNPVATQGEAERLRGLLQEWLRDCGDAGDDLTARTNEALGGDR